MPQFNLDARLQKDSHVLGHLGDTCLLLSRNAHFPWFILVPDTHETEFYMLGQDHQYRLLALINRLSVFIEKHFDADKLNIATIGNVVAQMHIHVVGRRHDDPCWPGVVWGCDQFREYPEAEVEQIRNNLQQAFADDFQLLNI
jgi:diadenosine tetraphosphate (Ap4A) HIT family hydrolase